jgi:hypothetical protein
MGPGLDMTNEVARVAFNTGVGVTGGVTSLWLNQVNGLLSLLVAVFTLVYLLVSIAKKVKELKGMD